MKKRKKLITAIMCFMMMFSCMSVYATEATPPSIEDNKVVTQTDYEVYFNDENTAYLEDYGLTAQDLKNMSAYLSSKANSSGDIKDKLLKNDEGEAGVQVPYVFKGTDGKVHVKAVSVPAKNIQKVNSKGQSVYVKGQIGDLVADVNIQPDMAAAGEIMESFREPISTFLGVLCFIIVFGLAIFTALDIAYITIPAFQGWSNMQKEAGSKGMTRSTGDGDVKLSFITKSAEKAVKAANMDENGGNPLTVYFKDRMGIYIMVSICIWMLLGNNITLITDIILNLLSGIMGLVSNFAG